MRDYIGDDCRVIEGDARIMAHMGTAQNTGSPT